jgi:hypothetical protein
VVPLRKTLLRATLCLVAAFAAVTSVAATSRASTGSEHRFGAAYAGHGNGQTSGTTASGSATMRGGGSLIGRGTLRGSGRGTFTSQTCVTFSGRAVLSGKKGTLRLVARRAHACAAGTGNNVSFSGTATVTGGTATFAGARGRLSFTGSFDRTNGSVKIMLSGLIRY